MATKTGNTYVSESIIDVIEIPKATLGFSTTAKKMSKGDCNNDPTPEMGTTTGNTYISKTI